MNTLTLEDRFAGCMLGHAVADALGAPFEGVPSEAIVRDHGGARRFVETLPIDRLIYTDDTQMMIGVAECLVERGEIEADWLAQRFAENYHDWRGYGQGARKILQAIAERRDWKKLTVELFPGGSFGNGAAMRAGPIGLLYHDNLERLDEQTVLASRITHAHPLGIEGATIFAAAVASATRMLNFDRQSFFDDLLVHATTEEFSWQLRTARKMSPDDNIIFGSSLPAHRSVVTAICCFAGSPDSFVDTVVRAINLGDDTDTVAGMAAALVGAKCGLGAIPENALSLLENEHKGKDHIHTLAKKLSGLKAKTTWTQS